ncbi:MAG: hypothetical protein JWN70_4257 [Planctomycetaceae bacterium]|nr:hypothetical protein [Planctomycetaceae bacterium]
MVARSGWFDDSQESREFLPRRSPGERLVTSLGSRQFPTGCVRAPLSEIFGIQPRQPRSLGLPELPTKTVLALTTLFVLLATDYCNQGALTLHRQWRQPCSVGNEDRAAVDTQGFAEAGDKKEQTNPTRLQNVAIAVYAFVAQAIGNQRHLIINHMNEPRGVASR